MKAADLSVSTLYPDSVKPKADTLRKSTDSLSIDNESAFDSQVDYQAEDSIRLEAENKKAYLFGKAVVHYGDFTLKADYIEIDNKTNLITASGMADSSGTVHGNPEFKDGQSDLRCEKIVYNLKTKKGKIYGILTKQNEFFVYGQAVKKDTNNVMYIKNMKCIPCEFEDAKIYFRAGKAKVIPGDKIVTGPLFVEVSNIPTPLGLPFGFFPNVKRNDSKAGIILPSYGNSQQQGFFVRNLGFFVPVSNKFHLTLFADGYTNGSFAFRPQAEYKVNYKYSGNFQFNYSRFITGVSEDRYVHYVNGVAVTDGDFRKIQNDFRITWQHAQDNRFDPSVRFSAGINAGSAGYQKYNNQSAATYLNSTLASNIAFSKTFKNSTLTLNARHTQNTQTRIVEVDAPSLTYIIKPYFPFKNENHSTQNFLDKLHIDYTFQSQATVIQKDSLFLKPSTLDSLKYGFKQTAPVTTNISLFKYFTLTPQAMFTQYTNFQSKEEKYDSLTKKINTFLRRDPSVTFDQSYSANLATKLYGDYLFKSRLIKQIRHQLIPTVGFVYHPNMQGSSLGFYKKVNDSLGNTLKYSPTQNSLYAYTPGAESGAITFGLNNTIEAKVRKKTDTSITYQKVSILERLSLNGSYDVAAKKNKLSMIILSANTSFFKRAVGLVVNATFDPYAIRSDGTRTDTFSFNRNGRLARFANASLSVPVNLTNAQIPSMKDSKLPWSIGANYLLNYTKSATPLKTPDNLTQTASLNFTFNPTLNWKFNVTTNYDLKKGAVSYTRFTITRNLRCWEAAINWVPFGFTKQYSIYIYLKTSSLRDMKIPKQKQWYDNL